MILHNLLYDCKSESSAVFFAEAHKRMKQLVTNWLCNAGTVVRDRNGDGVTGALNKDQNSALPAGRCLAGIQQKIVESTLQLAGIEPGQTRAVGTNLDQSALMARVQPHCLHGSL